MALRVLRNSGSFEEDLGDGPFEAKERFHQLEIHADLLDHVLDVLQ